MILVDQPFTSDLLIRILEETRYPVIRTEVAGEILSGASINFISEEAAISKFESFPDQHILTNSENALHWVEKKLGFTELPGKSRVFKEKGKLRDLLRDLYPGYFYKVLQLGELNSFDIKEVPVPFIIKPNVGFFSLGVHKVDLIEEWPETLKKIQEEVHDIQSLYPVEVLDTTDFIIEECITGTEYAVDCYFDKHGNPVVLNIMEHMFASGKDVSDRVYLVSGEVIEKLKPFVEAFLEEIGYRVALRNFPAHIEFRIDEQEKIMPIEINPLRFGGWCTSADLGWHAFGTSAYEYFFTQTAPDWEKIYQRMEGKVYGLIVLDNNTRLDIDQIREFDYEKLLADFEKPLDLRKADYRRYPLFGFLFTETRKDNMSELERILSSNLREYIIIQE